MLRSHVVTFHPIDHWPGTPTSDRRHWTGKASWSSTCDKLDLELFKLGAENVVFQVDLPASKIRRDGMPYADAVPREPGVIISFGSPKGPISFPCDTFTHWHHNTRAIALSLEALRAVDRYGVTRNAEQYRGWQKLGVDPSVAGGQVVASRFADVHAAAAWIAQTTGEKPLDALSSSVGYRHLRKLAARRCHPDANGGDHARWRDFQAAAELLDKHHNLT